MPFNGVYGAVETLSEVEAWFGSSAVFSIAHIAFIRVIIKKLIYESTDADLPARPET